jgi:uncharacterized SAM-binding protein YcdF (DUF218 family)
VLSVVDKFFNVLVRPADAALGVLMIVLALMALGRRRLADLLLVGMVLAALSLYLLPIDDWVLYPLEARFAKPVSLPACIRGILILGGGQDRRATTAWGEPTLLGDFGSLLEASRIAKLHPEAVIVFSGYGTDPRAMVTEAAIARPILEAMGVAPGRIRLEDRSRDTWQNLVYSKLLVAPRPGENWVLVGAAFHIPRSIAIARHLGWDMIADPTSYLSVPPGAGLPQVDLVRKLDHLGLAFHEWLGLLAYRLEGRTETLFPSPGASQAPRKSESPQCVRAF